jgi:HSP20 family protein
METKSLVPTFGRRILPSLVSLRDDMDRLFNQWLAAADMEPLHLFDGKPESFMPRIDVTESKEGLEVTAELPGVEEKDIEIELGRKTLVLRGQKNVEKEETGEGFHRQERRFGSFYRQIALPWEVDVTKTSAAATFAKGVLHVKVPRPESAEPATRKIAIAGQS